MIYKKLVELYVRYTSRDFVEYYNRTHKNDDFMAVRIGKTMKIIQAQIIRK